MSPAPVSWPPSLDARYECLEEAGRGGMGVVYKARDRETGELVALKILKPEIAIDQIAAERFINEVRLSRRITHKNVCRVYEFSRAGSTAYLSMEFVEGESLRSILSRLGAVTLRKGLQIGRQICAALHEAHTQGIIHRDLKPENVMLDRHGNVKVMDFGIARLLDAGSTTTGGILGTPAYMSPEQAESKDVDTRTDIYAIGLILYELFTGRSAFTGDTPVAIALKQIREVAPPPRTIEPSIPQELETAIVRCLEKDPARRFQSVEELDAALAAVPVSTTTPVAADRKAETSWPSVARPDTVRAWTRHLTPRSPVSKRVVLATALALAAVLAGWAGLGLLRADEDVPFTAYRLDNGLQVLVSEDRSAPTVAVAVTYDVGARDERPGRSGFAHLFEHLMFRGSLNVGNGEHVQLVSNNGGMPDGSAQIDQTQYWQTLPANQLELALFLEADRMRALRLDQTQLDAERGAVLAEVQQRSLNQPYGRMLEALYATAYDTTAYQRTTYGNPDDLRAATLQDVSDFFRVYYAPNNAVLSIVGDVDSGDVRRKVEKYFQHIPAQPPAPRPDLTEPPPSGERRKTIEDRFAPAPRVHIAFKGPVGNAADWSALQILGTILASGQSSRFAQKLVREAEVATSAEFALDRRRGAGLFWFVLTPHANRDESAVVQAFEAAVDEVRQKGIADGELARARTRIKLSRAAQLQDTYARALLLGEYAVKHGDPNRLNARRADLDAATASDVQRVATEYLVPARRTIITVVPAPRTEIPPAATFASTATAPTPAAAGAATPAQPAAAQVELLNRAPVSKDVLRVGLPKPREITLDNGLAIVVTEDRRVPLVSVRFEIREAGLLHDPPELPGVAQAAAAMLNEGTTSRTSRAIAEEMDAFGATVTAGATSFDPAITFITATGLSETFARWFPILGEIVVNPVFPSDELTQYKTRQRNELRTRRSSGSQAAMELLHDALWGALAGGPGPVTQESVTQLTSDRLKAWHRERYLPQRTTLSIAGALEADDAIEVVQPALSGWQQRSDPPRAAAPAPAVATSRVLLIDRPGSVQTSVALGGRAVDRLSPDLVPLVVLNRLLGGSATSRLYVKLRAERGYLFGIGSAVTAHALGGDWRVAGDLNEARTADAVTALMAELRRIASEPVPGPELDAAKRAIVASFALTLERLTQLAAYAASRRTYGLSADYWDRFPEKIMAVTPADIQRVAQQYLDLSRAQIVAVGNAATLAPILAPYGAVTRYTSELQPVR